MGHCFGYGGATLEADLSPVSALRLHFDTLTPETTDPMADNIWKFGLPVSEFIPQGFASWMGQSASSRVANEANAASNDSKKKALNLKVCLVQLCKKTTS